MKKLWSVVTELIRAKAVHRRGFVLGEQEDRFIVRQAEDELAELDTALELEDKDEACLQELADVFGCLVHLAVKRGWTPEMVEEKALEKLRARFTVPGDPTTAAKPFTESDRHAYNHKILQEDPAGFWSGKALLPGETPEKYKS